MIITEAGPVTENIQLLGRPESCVYLVTSGNESVLIGGGMAYIAHDVLQQIESLGGDEGNIKRLIILHSHFDHCGAVPYFKKHWPWAKVTASVRAKQLLSDERVSEMIQDLNHEAIVRAGLEARAEELGLEFTGIKVDDTIAEGDVISCGALSLEVIEVPGHSSCSIALNIPQEKALFTSDAAGIRCNDFFLAAANSNFDLYQQSLRKLAGYDVDAVLAGHYGASLGKDARVFLPNAIDAAKKTRAFLEESILRTRDAKKTAAEITDFFIRESPDSFLSRDVVSLVTGQMVKYIAKKMGI